MQNVLHDPSPGCKKEDKQETMKNEDEDENNDKNVDTGNKNPNLPSTGETGDKTDENSNQGIFVFSNNEKYWSIQIE